MPKPHPRPTAPNACAQCLRQHGQAAYCECGACLYKHATQKGIPREVLENVPLVKCDQCGRETFWE